MTGIYNDIALNVVATSNKANSRKKAMQELSAMVASEINYPSQNLFDLLMDKEYHACSGIGGGVAIPQFKLKNLDKPVTAMIVLEKPVPFGANDGKPVDIICALFSPENDGPLHLRRLARLTRTLKDRELCEKIRDAGDEDIIRSLLISPEGWLLAA